LLIAGGFVSTGHFSILPFLFAGVFISGLARSFYMPASFTLLSQTVKKIDMPAASAWMSGSFQAAAIGGPAIAGLIYAGFGARIAWFLPLFALTACFAAICAIRVEKLLRDKEHRLPALRSIREGWEFILKNPVLLSVMALDMFAVLFGGAVAMLPAFADQVLKTGAEGLGILRAAPAVGSVSMALYLALNPMKIISARKLLIAVTGFGVCMIGFGLSKSFILSLCFLAGSGAFDSVSMVIRGTLMQLLTPDAMRGRVSSVNSMFIISSNEIGAFESGLAAKLIGLVPSVVFGGFGTLFVAGMTSILSPKFRRTEVRSDQAA
jgi:MFS family permease